MLCMYTLYFKWCTLYKFIEINSLLLCSFSNSHFLFTDLVWLIVISEWYIALSSFYRITKGFNKSLKVNINLLNPHYTYACVKPQVKSNARRYKNRTHLYFHSNGFRLQQPRQWGNREKKLGTSRLCERASEKDEKRLQNS